MASIGEKYRAKGYRPNLPLLIVPGLMSSCLKVVETPYEPWVNRRIWLDTLMIGMDKVLEGLPLFGRKKKKTVKEKKNKTKAEPEEDEDDIVVETIQTLDTSDLNTKRRLKTHIYVLSETLLGGRDFFRILSQNCY